MQSSLPFNRFPFVIDSQNKNVPRLPIPVTVRSTITSWPRNVFTTRPLKILPVIWKKWGLYENSVIVIYGDHYEISNSRNLKLAHGKSSSTWSDYDNAQLQRVPFMIPHSRHDGRKVLRYLWRWNWCFMAVASPCQRWHQKWQCLVLTCSQPIIVKRWPFILSFITPHYTVIK